VYTRVLKVPVEDIEGIWREYDMFEGMVNKITVSSESSFSLRKERSPERVADFSLLPSPSCRPRSSSPNAPQPT